MEFTNIALLAAQSSGIMENIGPVFCSPHMKIVCAAAEGQPGGGQGPAGAAGHGESGGGRRPVRHPAGGGSPEEAAVGAP